MNTNSPSTQLLRSWQNSTGVVNGVFLIVVLLLAMTATKAEAGYTFTLIADSTGLFDQFGSLPSLNATGTVAYRAWKGYERIGVYASSGGTTTTIAVSTAPFAAFGDPTINQAGTVAFFAAPPDGHVEGIFTGNGGPLVTIADTAVQFRRVDNKPSINAAGIVAFSAAPISGTGGIFTNSGGVSSQTVIGGGNPSINDAGTVAFQGYLNQHYAIATSNGGAITTIADDSGQLKTFLSRPSINNAGTVAFVAGVGGIDDGGYGIYSGNGGSLTTIADLSGPFNYINLYGSASINSAGAVAFGAGLDAGGGGLFIGDGTVTNAVIGAGDALFGSTVTGFGISPTSLNDSGQVAFYYRLANGTTGIAIATPVPEPSASFLAIASAAIGFTRRRRS